MIGLDQASHDNGPDPREEPGAVPVINENALGDAMMILRTAEDKIKRYARDRGLPVDVRVHTSLNVRLECHRRIFLGFNNKRNLTHAHVRLGPGLWELINATAIAYKTRYKE